MWIALALVALIIVAAVIVVIFRRPEGDDIDSVRSYHTALGTLEHLSDRTGRSSVSIVERGERPGVEGQVPRSYQRSTGAAGVARTVTAASPGGGTGGSVPPVPVRGNDEFPDPEILLVFEGETVSVPLAHALCNGFDHLAVHLRSNSEGSRWRCPFLTPWALK